MLGRDYGYRACFLHLKWHTGLVQGAAFLFPSECPAKLTMSPCNSYPAAAWRSKPETQFNEVGHLIGVNPLALAVVVTPGSFMGQRQLGDHLYHTIYIVIYYINIIIIVI